MALPLYQDALATIDVEQIGPDLSLVSTAEADIGEDFDTISSRITEILGYDPELIRSGTSTLPDHWAIGRYNDLLTSFMGYSMLADAPLHADVQSALDEIAQGQTTVALSVDELRAQLDSAPGTDD